MAKAKDLLVQPIRSHDANRLVRRLHYSGKVVNNSQLHLGVFLDGKIEGVMQFGPSLDKRKTIRLVSGTRWNGFIELNRLAFSDVLPRNSESRALGVALRLIRNNYSHIEWVVSFADATQSGDGSIYRACGFALTGIKKNTQIWESPLSTKVFSRMSLTDGRSKQQQAQDIAYKHSQTKSSNIHGDGSASMRKYIDAGWKPKSGFQLRYVYFINLLARARLTVPILPYSAISEIGASMYRGVRVVRPK